MYIMREWDADGISIRILMANREMPKPAGITLSDDSRSLHKKPVVLKNERSIFSKIV